MTHAAIPRSAALSRALPRAALFGLALLLAACGGRGAERHASQTSPSAVANHVTPARFDDDDPHPAITGQTRRYPVHGIDLSRFQTSVDWREARAGGVNFAFIKAVEGGDLLDPMFDSHWRGAGQAGVRRGAYLFYYHCRPVEEQVRWYIAHVPRSPGALPPVLDMEWTPTSPTCRIRRSPEVIRAEAAEGIRLLTRHYGTAPILYTTVDFFEDNALWQLGGAEFWLRSVAAHPSDRYPGQHWRFWQYSSTGRVPGIAGQVDMNAFAGSRADWDRWLEARSQR